MSPAHRQGKEDARRERRARIRSARTCMIRLPRGLRELHTMSPAMVMTSSSNHAPRPLRWGNGLIYDERTTRPLHCTAATFNV